MPVHVMRFAGGNDPTVVVDRDCVAVTGACLLMNRTFFKMIGGFDEDYVMYVEDVDLCLRVWNEGKRVRYCGSSVVEHLESASTVDLERRDALVRERWQTMHARWGGSWPGAVRICRASRSRWAAYRRTLASRARARSSSAPSVRRFASTPSYSRRTSARSAMPTTSRSRSS